MHQNVYGVVSDATLKIRELMKAVTSLGLGNVTDINECKGLLATIENDFANTSDVFVNAARDLLSSICEDGVISDTEREAMSSFASVFDDPIINEPIEAIREKNFVLTGDFGMPGGKGTAIAIIEAGGGECKGGVSKKVSYVVVGSLGSDAWAFGKFGGKVKKALDLKLSKGVDIKIVTEDALLSFIKTSKSDDAIEALRKYEMILDRFGKNFKGARVVSETFAGLTGGQQRMLDAVKAGRNIYLTGLGGTGKSYVIERVIERANDEGKNVIVCAPTGIAALNIGGTTIHHALGIRPEKTMVSNANPWINDNSPLIACDLMIVDEISMCRVDLFDYLSRALKNAAKLRTDGKGVCQLVVVGDFCQLPPVLTKDDKPVLAEMYGRDIGHGYPFSGDEWDSWEFEYLELTEAIRQRDAAFVEALNACRIGNTEGLKWIEENSAKEPADNAIVLCGKNKVAADVNIRSLRELPAEEVLYVGVKDGDVEAVDMPTDLKLTLKEGARVMALANNATDTYMNGSLGTVLKCTDEFVEVMFDSGNTARVYPHTWEILKPVAESGKTKYKCIGTFTQIPLKLSYAITIHKSQGQTFNAASIYPECWEPGQLYTALSRLCNIKGLHLAYHCADSFLIAAPEVVEFYELHAAEA